MSNEPENESMFAEERKNAIAEYINKNRKSTVNELCKIFKVSPATIRNDLNELENAGLLKRTHGGAIPNIKANYELNSNQKKVEHIKEKEAIAKKALAYVEDGDTIAIDTGTTTLCFARLLVSKKNLTIVTNDIEIAGFLEENSDFDIVLIGGRVRRGFHCSVGPIALKCMEGLRVDKAFIASNSVSVKNGITTPSIELAQIKTSLMSFAEEVYLLSDSSKFGRASFVKFADITDIDTIITDKGLPDLQIKELEQLDVVLDIV
jgi:DeoR family fructose operon transcriptional repressor